MPILLEHVPPPFARNASRGHYHARPPRSTVVRRAVLTLLPLLLALRMLATPAATGAGGGAAYYVAPNGDDGNPGTLAAPLSTIQAGLDRLLPGDTLYLRGGRYYPASQLWLPRSGLPDQPIAIRNYQGETPIIDGRDALDQIIVIDSRDWIVLDGLTVQNAGGAWGNGISLLGTTSDTLLRNVTVRQVRDSGIYIEARANGITVANCDVSGAVTGVRIHGRNVLVDGCESHDNGRMVNDGFDCDSDPQTGGDHGGQAFAVNETAGPVEIRNSEGWNNKAPSICYGTDGAFVELYRSQNVNIHHNRSRDGVVTFETAGDTSGIRIWRNEARNEMFLNAHQANAMTVANNTVWNTLAAIDRVPLVWVGADGHFGTGATAGLVFVNNILATGGAFLGVDRAWDATATIDHNIYHRIGAGNFFGSVGSTDYNSLAAWQAGQGRDAASLAADPWVVDAANGDFHLTATSPAIGRGFPVVAAADDSTGGIPDIGRWQYR